MNSSFLRVERKKVPANLMKFNPSTFHMIKTGIVDLPGTILIWLLFQNPQMGYPG